MKLSELNIFEGFEDYGFNIEYSGSANDPLHNFRNHNVMGAQPQLEFDDFDEAREYADEDIDSIILLEAENIDDGVCVSLVMAQQGSQGFMGLGTYRVVDCDGNTVKDGMSLEMTKKFFETRHSVVERKSADEDVSFRYIVLNHDNKPY